MNAKPGAAFLLCFLMCLLSCAVSNDAPRLLSVSVEDGQRVDDAGSFRSITIAFSKPMSRRAVEQNVLLSGYDGDLVRLWRDGNRTLILVLVDPLREGERYELEIGGGCECEEGFDLGCGHRRVFYTYAVDDPFEVAWTEPADGAAVAVLDGLRAEVRFSLPVEHASVLDKVTIEPEISYRYAFSSDRKTLSLEFLEHLAPNGTYRVVLSEELRAQGGTRLGKPFIFSFSTVVSRAPFRLLRAAMVSGGATGGGIALDIGYLGRTGGVGKDMELYAEFSSDFFLGSAKRCAAVEPSIPYTLVKEGSALRFRFDRPMTPEETYRATFAASMKNAFGIALDREYSFEWTVNAEGSTKLRPLSIRLKNPFFLPEEPELFPHTEIFRQGAPIHNRTLLPYYAGGETRAEIEAVFSAALDVYRSIDGGNIRLDFAFGDAPVQDAALRDVRWAERERALAMVFALPPAPGGAGATYTLTLEGGEGGIVDREGNFLASDVLIHVRYAP